jgi:hypothetical protein
VILQDTVVDMKKQRSALAKLVGQVSQANASPPKQPRVAEWIDYGVFLFWYSYSNDSANVTHAIFPKELVDLIVVTATEDERWIVITPRYVLPLVMIFFNFVCRCCASFVAFQCFC